MKLTPKLAESIASLRQSGPFREFLEGLGDYGEQAMHSCLYSEGEASIVYKGEARAVTAILKAISEAPAYVEKYKERT